MNQKVQELSENVQKIVLTSTTLLTFSLLINEDFWLFLLIFSALAVFSAHLSEDAETLRSPLTTHTPSIKGVAFHPLN